MASTPSSSSSPPSEVPTSPQPNWLNLPPEVTSSILHRLGAIEIIEVAQKVCVTWRKICKDSSMWRSIDMRNKGNLYDLPYDLEKMCRHAVDRSCGGLQEISIEYFGTDDLLLYIMDRAPQLKSLRLACCYGISDEGLTEVAKKLPNLQELHMFLTAVSKETLENIGRCCPQLNSLTYNIQGSRVPYIEDDDGEGDALAIAQTMPGLRHLSLFGNQMTNVGLQAILDGCLHLDSLDLRQCFNVNLGGAFGRTCAKKIKNLKCPNDSIEGYEYDATVYEGCGYNSFDDEFPSAFSEIDFLSDADDDYQFSGGSAMSEDYDGLFDF